MSILLFDKVCLYDNEKNETIIYGQYTPYVFTHININTNIFESIVFNSAEKDFLIKLKGKIYLIETIGFTEYTNTYIEFKNIHLYFPFEDCDLQLKSNSAIISTICKDSSHRLDEWIQYNLKLGFSGIVIFDNSENKSNEINETLEYCDQTFTINEICNKYKGYVWVVNMPYSPAKGESWNVIQRIACCIGVNAFRNKCRNIALIGIDEFIYLPNNDQMKIEDFLQNYSTITMKSNILTNKNDNDFLNNNILQLAKYVGEDKYTKCILHTDKINQYEFINTPHDHITHKIMNKDDIIHYHCWMNKRYKYDETMPIIDIF
jgi:hypothetical protein